MSGRFRQVFLYFSELTWTWYIEDRNINAEMVISVRENHLLRSPGCLKERVEIYMGKIYNRHTFCLNIKLCR